MRNEIVEAISGISADPNELAYFALTSKPEAQLRDRLAYRLHQQLVDRELIVAREWRRTDLAILQREGAPLALIEAKALLSADLLYPIRVEKWRQRVLADIQKARECAEQAKAPEAEIFALVITTHVLTEVRSDQWEFVKYGARLASVTPWKEAERQMRSILPEASSPQEHCFGYGEAFGVGVELTTWLFGPVKRVPHRSAV